MLNIFTVIGDQECAKEGILFTDVAFVRDFGPFKEGEHCHKLRFSFKPLMLEELDPDGNVIRSQSANLITANNVLPDIIKYLDDDNNPEMLFTKDGRRVYSFYSGTRIPNYLHHLYSEIKPK